MPYGFGMRDAKVAPRTGDAAWGTAVDVEAIQMLGFTINTTNAMLEGDDIIVDAHSKIIGATVRMRFGFSTNHLDVWEVLLGKAPVDSGGDKYMVIAGENPPYFGVCGKVEHTSGGGDWHLWAPKCKLQEGLSLEAGYGTYQTPELTVQCLIEDDTHGVIVPIYHATAIPVVIPPVFGAA